ncbi:MAG: alpha/beta hydrolase [Gammaproteobacteria bacterium]
MNASTRVFTIPGPVGEIDVALDLPGTAVQGVAVVAHPHPLFSGTRDNKVAQTLARALRTLGYACWRPNFRGVGKSAGEHDEGRGETDDLLAVVAAARAWEGIDARAAASLVLAGFSFGSFVQTRVAARLQALGQPARRLVLVGTAVSRFVAEPVPADTVLIHGELDDTVPLQAVFDWARPQQLPVIMIPGADHFFHGRLPLIKRLVIEAVGHEDAGPAKS